MICPKCAASSHVLDTRQGGNLTTNRRRECRNGHIFHTVERHVSVTTGDARRVAQFARRIAADQARAKRDATIAAELHRGWQRLAERFNLTKGSVYAAARRSRKNGTTVR